MVGPYLFVLYLLITRTYKPMTTRWVTWLLLNPLSIGGLLILICYAASLFAAALVWD